MARMDLTNRDGESASDTPRFTASDMRDAAGLTYRQINGWDSKGAMPGQREGQAGWRKFSPREVFAVMVCSEIRKRFGVPVESLRFVHACMLKEGADHLSYAINTMALGLTVWLITDLGETFIMDTDSNFQDLFAAGCFRGDDPSAHVLVRINPIVNRFLGVLKEPVQLKIKDEIYELINYARSLGRAGDARELALLDLVRNHAYSQVVVKLKDGEIVSATTEAELGGQGREVSGEEIRAIVEGQRYQTVTLTKHDGRVIRVTQSVPLPLRSKGKRPASNEAASTGQKDPDRRGGHPKRK